MSTSELKLHELCFYALSRIRVFIMYLYMKWIEILDKIFIIINIRVDVCSHKTSLTPPLFIEVSVQTQESERPCLCVLWVSILPLFLWFLSIRLWTCSDSVVCFGFHFDTWVETNAFISQSTHLFCFLL